MQTQFVMPKFNKELQVTVDVDMVAQQLLSLMKEDNPHRELLTYNIVGNLKESGKLGSIFSAMAGYHKEINIVVGKQYECLGSDLDSTYDNVITRDEWNKTRVVVTALEINPFTTSPIKVEFKFNQKRGENVSEKLVTCNVRVDELIEITAKKVGHPIQA